MWKRGDDDPEITVWIDNDTGVPLKRVVVQSKGKEFRTTEVYSEFKLNPKIDAKVFDLPK